MPGTKGNKNAVGNKGGRPKVEMDILWEGWYNDILNLYREGGSDEEVRGMIIEKTERGTFSIDLWDRWLSEEIEFSETIKAGRMMSARWWHQNGRINLQNKEFNYTGWYMQMKNRFGWKDRTDITTQDEKIDFNYHVAKE